MLSSLFLYKLLDFFSFLELYFRLSVLLLPLCYSCTTCLMFTLTLTSLVQWSLVTILCRQWPVLSFSMKGSSQDSKIAISKKVSYSKEKRELSFRDNCTILKTKNTCLSTSICFVSMIPHTIGGGWENPTKDEEIDNSYAHL